MEMVRRMKGVFKMKKWLLSSAALLMLSPTAAYANGTDTYVNAGASKIAYNAVANTEITTWDQVVKEVVKQMNEFSTDISIIYKGSMTNFSDNALAAFDKAKQQAVYAGEHIESISSSTDTAGNIKFKIKYLTNKAQEEIVQKKVDQVLANIITPSMTTFQKVKAVNDYIVSNAKYGESTKSSPHSAHALLIEGQAVCQGYALLTYKMLNQIGVDVQYVVGVVDGNVPHAWNLVKIDGKWYHLDTTWNDPVPDRKGAVRYQYFLVDDRTMAQDHSWIASDYPKATSTKYSYYHDVDFPAQVGQQLFYSNRADNNKLYVLDMNTGKSERVTASRAQYIVYANGWLYFSNYSRGAYLSKIRPDGSGEVILNREDTKDLFVKDGYLYFTTNGPKKMALQ